MTGRVNDGETCIIAPVTINEVALNDIVLCKVGGKEYLHLVKAKQGNRIQIGNNKGGINGWIGESGLFGRLLRIE